MSFTYKFDVGCNKYICPGDFYRETDKAIKVRWDAHVTALPVQFSTDATELSRTESRSAKPVYVKNLLLSAKTLVTQSGIEVVGFFPEITQNDTILSAILSKRGVSGIGKQEEACKVNRKWVEQDFLDRFTRTIRECQETGPIILQVNRNGHKFYQYFMPFFAGFTCKFNVIIA